MGDFATGAEAVDLQEDRLLIGHGESENAIDASQDTPRKVTRVRWRLIDAEDLVARDAEQVGEPGDDSARQAQPSALVRAEVRLAYPQMVSNLDLRHTASPPEACDPSADGLGSLVVGGT